MRRAVYGTIAVCQAEPRPEFAPGRSCLQSIAQLAEKIRVQKMRWHFPLPRPHTGALLGNGTQGLMVWGNEALLITVGRAGFWDHRGGSEFASKITFRDLRELLERGDEASLRQAFAGGAESSRRPRQLGCGRVEIKFANYFQPKTAELDLVTATLRVTLKNPTGGTATVMIRQTMGEEIAWIDFGDAPVESITAIPARDLITDALGKTQLTVFTSATGYPEAEKWHAHNHGGFSQTLPADDPVALAWESNGTRLVIATALEPDAKNHAISFAKNADIVAATGRAEIWWREYWNDVPRLNLPDPVLQQAWDYGVYKQAGMSTPGAVAATLQGPWMEDNQLPPWSNDYHFNINIQMIYWPCLATNRLAHFQPLWEMLHGWMPRLRENAERFFGAPEALMLPHAVDDRCQVVGNFWTGTIDQACAGWMAQMAWLHYRFSMDEKILREIAWPMLNGAFNGYWAMLEEILRDGKKRLSLPVSVSPEYGGAGMNAWGRDASFQLAALHFLAETLPKAAEILGEKSDDRWGRVRAELPPYTLAEKSRIALWENQDLAESHRHHSHLASIFPFCTIDPFAAPHRDIVKRSLDHWLEKGAGRWTGWCLPWASILCARCNMPDAAVAWLHWWEQVYTNEGHGTLHDADFPGCNLLHAGEPVLATEPERTHEIMQMDATFGALQAIIEILVQQRGDTLFILPRIPTRWRDFEFDGIRTEGAFLVGATVREKQLVEVRVKSLAGGLLKIAPGFSVGDAVFSRTMRADESLVILRPPA